MAKQETQQAQIQFYKTMVANKRGAGAYLRKNLLNTKEEGVYPAVDFGLKNLGESSEVTEILFMLDDFVFTNEGGTTKVYMLNITTGAFDYKYDMPENTNGMTGAKTNTYNEIVVVIANGKTYKIATSATYYDTVGGFQNQHIAYNGFYHYVAVSDSSIYKFDPTGTMTTAKTVAGGFVENLQIFNNYLVVAITFGNGIQFNFWDTVEADAALYTTRVFEDNCRHLALGVIYGRFIFVKLVGDVSNRKEFSGGLIVSAFDGEKFEEMNAIRTDGLPISTGNSYGILESAGQSQSVGNGIMLVSIRKKIASGESDYNSYIYKIKRDGEIELLFTTEDDSDQRNSNCVLIKDSYLAISIKNNPSAPYTYSYYDTNQSDNVYANYEKFTMAEYVTNFLNNTKNVHKLTAFGVAYEKVFKQLSELRGERLYIDCRASERDDWTLLHEVNTETIKNYTADEYNEDLRQTEYDSDTTGQTIQSYVIKKMPNGDELPRFNEIQFRFRTTKGFSIIQAWYNYEYIKRNTV